MCEAPRENDQFRGEDQTREIVTLCDIFHQLARKLQSQETRFLSGKCMKFHF